MKEVYEMQITHNFLRLGVSARGFCEYNDNYRFIDCFSLSGR